jgi:hypothetical protein
MPHLTYSGGDYTTLVDPDLTAFTLVLETFAAGRCAQPAPSAPQTLIFAVSGGLPGPGTPLAVWRSNATTLFLRASDTVVGADGTFTVTIAPYEMVTVTTLVNEGGHGVPATPIPPSQPFPLPYADNFTGYTDDTQASYLADEYGSFAVRNCTLQQASWERADPPPPHPHYTTFLLAVALLSRPWQQCLVARWRPYHLHWRLWLHRLCSVCDKHWLRATPHYANVCRWGTSWCCTV